MLRASPHQLGGWSDSALPALVLFPSRQAAHAFPGRKGRHQRCWPPRQVRCWSGCRSAEPEEGPWLLRKAPKRCVTRNRHPRRAGCEDFQQKPRLGRLVSPLGCAGPGPCRVAPCRGPSRTGGLHGPCAESAPTGPLEHPSGERHSLLSGRRPPEAAPTLSRPLLSGAAPGRLRTS